MKQIYIAGLEHSGTTLTTHLLSAHPSFIGPGEIASFFSPDHMTRYIERWGGYPDVSLCSCGEPWERCEFWGNLVHLCGLYSALPMLEKYRLLLEHVRATRGDDVVLVDSSKSLIVLRRLIDGRAELGIGDGALSVVFTVKDVRSFAKSMISKSDAKRSFLWICRSFNYWHGENRRFLDYLLQSRDVTLAVNLYESLCQDAEGFVARQAERLGFGPARKVAVGHNHSHIAMGNKNFLIRNRSRISYDSRWYTDDMINLVYLLHYKARAFNKRLYALSAETVTGPQGGSKER